LKEAIFIIKPKNIPALAGKSSLNKGIITIICYVLIIDQSCDRPAVRKMFITKFPAMIPLVKIFIGPIAALRNAVPISLPYYLGIADFKVFQLGSVLA
jgi:hypothetical protein